MVQVFVASTRGPEIDLYREVAFQQIGLMKDDDRKKWTAVSMENDAHAQSMQDGSTTAEWGPKDIKRCDAVLLIVGTRYGSLVQGTCISYTEREYNMALDQNKYTMAFIFDVNKVAKGNSETSVRALGLLKEIDTDKDDPDRLVAFIKRLRADENLIIEALPLTFDEESGWRNRLTCALQEFQRRHSTVSGAAAVPASKFHEMRDAGVSVMNSHGRVTVTWESTLKHDRESIQSRAESWPAPQDSLLAVRRAGTDAAYVVLRDRAGVTILRMRSDGAVKAASVEVVGGVDRAELKRGPDLGLLVLHSPDAQVTNVRTDELHFSDPRSPDVAPS